MFIISEWIRSLFSTRNSLQIETFSSWVVIEMNKMIFVMVDVFMQVECNAVANKFGGENSRLQWDLNFVVDVDFL